LIAGAAGPLPLSKITTKMAWRGSLIRRRRPWPGFNADAALHQMSVQRLRAAIAREKETLMKLYHLLLLFCALGSANVAHGVPLSGQSIGAYGDSMTMQYSLWVPLATANGYPLFSNGTQFNWVDQLVKSGYNFGPVAPFPVPIFNGSTYNTYDAGIVGAKSGDVDGTEVGFLQPSIPAGGLHVIVDIIGANDFNSTVTTTIYNDAASKSYNPQTDPTTVAYLQGVYNNIAAGIADTLAEYPNQKMILATIPDPTLTPSEKASYPIASQHAAITEAIQSLNAQIISLAASYHFPVVDMFGLGNLASSLTSLGGVTMINAGGTSGNDLYLSDGFHPGTVMQGIIANTVLQADHVAYGDSVTPISEQQSATWAGLTPNKSTTFFNVNPYVIYTAPEPSTLVLAGFAAIGFVAAACAKRRRSAGR
jgi:lysophospholipase L1-like esterase